MVQEFGVVIIGSGFGGSVSAMRLAQKGYKVAVLETGKRFGPLDFPKSNWNLRKYLWAPALRCFGIQQITFLKGLMVLHGAGVGGGSLVYAATLLKPEDSVFRGQEWPSSTDWVSELAHPFSEARRMLGVAKNPDLYAGEESLRELSRKMNAESTFSPTEVGLYFGDKNPPERASDPFFGGAGPARSSCTRCGGCMIGCRVGAKNTLDYNYLFFAEKLGARVFPETRATRITPVAGGGYKIETEVSTSWRKKAGPIFHARKLILSAGVLGTLRLLLQNRDVYKTLPHLSAQLGQDVRTNGESLLGVTSFRMDQDYSRGIAIGASFKPDQVTKIECVRYPAGSGAMRWLGVPLTGNGGALVRPLKMLFRVVTRFHRMIRLFWVDDWAKRSLILLVMQTVDAKMRLGLRGKRISRIDTSERDVPAYLPVAQKAAQELGEIMKGEPQNVISEVILKSPATAHILGGCRLAERSEEGVVDPNHEVFGYPGMYVCDGSVMPSNLGVNPSLTIAALAERFADQWPVSP